MLYCYLVGNMLSHDNIYICAVSQKDSAIILKEDYIL